MQRQSHVTLVNLVQLYSEHFSSIPILSILHLLYLFSTCFTMSKILPQFTAIAASLLDDYVSKKRDQRAAVLTSAVEQVKALAEKDHLHVPLMIQKVWFAILHSQLLFITSIAETRKLVSKQPS